MPTKRKKTAGKKKRRWPKIAAGLIIVIILGIGGLFSWYRWFCYSDVSDFTGQWVVSETGNTINISATEIELSDSIQYSYTLDTWGKTITFNFGDMSGQGRYQFSQDRTYLIIVEGQGSDLLGDTLRLLSIQDFEEVEDVSKRIVFERA
jgi:hypothetical protein